MNGENILHDIKARYIESQRTGRIRINPAGIAMWRAIGWHMQAKADKLGPEPMLDTMAAMICRLGVLEMRQGFGAFGF